MTKKSHECFGVWKAMRQRCICKTDRAYKNYGGRGISVDERWKGFGGFDRFMSDMGPRPKGGTIERIDNDGNYCKENCRWASRLEQNNNTRITVKITFNGKTQSIALWSKELGFNKGIIKYRLNHGWPLESALTIRPYGGKKVIKIYQ